ncbi:MAG: hypothetical protein JWR08_383, partial [Enterovirga sp.]|nr:hypothetical protein [Enterovirga sp.]
MKLFRRRGAATVQRHAEGRWKRVVRRVFYVKLALVAIGLAAVGSLYLRLVSGPLSLQGYSTNLADALASRIGPGWRVTLGGTAVQMVDGRPSVRVTGLEIRNPAGVLLVRSPDATVTLDPAGLFTGTLSPRDIDLRQLQLTVLVAPDGTLSFVDTADDRGAASEPPAVPAIAPQTAGEPSSSAVAKAVASLLDPVLRPTGIVGALDRASVTDARLTLIGSDGRERLAFRDVDALFVRQEGGARHFELGFEGRRGTWSVEGEVTEAAGERRATVRAHNVPLEDAMLLGGLSAVPGASDLKLSGDVQAVQSGGRLVTFAGRFESPAGTITLPGQDSVRVDQLAGRAAWNEGEHRLELSDVTLKSGAAAIQVDGTLAATGEGAWTLAVSGRDGVLPGATATDPPLKLAEIGAQFGLVSDAIVVERVSLKGEGVDVAISGASVPSPDGMGLRATIEARQTGVRQLLALWPTTVNPELRGYLGANLRSGTLETMRLGTNLDATDLRNAFSGKPISDAALSLAFTVTDGRLTIIDGLPPLRRLGIVGSATGTTTTLSAKQGRVDMPDGRRLLFADGSYRQVDEHKPGSVARIAFRLEGGADAVASFLRSPVFGELGPIDIDPNGVKGRAEFQVTLPLSVRHIPKVADLPISVTGKLSDLSVDKVFGREKLEGANLVVSYESGALGIKGEGKLGGSPATLDLRQPRGGAGEVLVGLTLDEAARARRSLPVGPQVVGPVAVKIAAPFGHKGATRMEADLSRAGIEGLLPGWIKPAGRPGRLVFTI